MGLRKPIPQEGVPILNGHTPKNTTAKYVKQKVLEVKEEIHNRDRQQNCLLSIGKWTIESTGIVGDFSTLLSRHDKTMKQKLFHDVELNTKNQLISLTFVECST